jgi:hypothetical protein
MPVWGFGVSPVVDTGEVRFGIQLAVNAQATVQHQLARDHGQV